MYLPAVHVEKELGVVGVVNVPEADAPFGAREALSEEGRACGTVAALCDDLGHVGRLVVAVAGGR